MSISGLSAFKAMIFWDAMELISEDNDILLIKTTRRENIVLRDVLKVAHEFDPGLWTDEDLDSVEDIYVLLANAEKRIEQEEITMTRQEFRALDSLLIIAAHGVVITNYGLEKEPILTLMKDFDRILTTLCPDTSKFLKT